VGVCKKVGFGKVGFGETGIGEIGFGEMGGHLRRVGVQSTASVVKDLGVFIVDQRK
jgi:hypothetical protein